MRPFMLLFFFIFSSSNTFAEVISVPGDQTTIQAGINAAADGDTVLVAENTYYENINFKGKAITVASMFLMDQDTAHISKTIIDGSQPSHADSGSVVVFKSGEDTTSVLCGFTITGGTGTYIPSIPIRDGGGIFCLNSGAKIIYNYIKNNSVFSSAYAGSGGIGIGPPGNESWAVISNNRIEYNSASGSNWVYGGALEVFSNAHIKDNLITHNQGLNWGEFYPALVTGIVYFGDDTTIVDRNFVSITGNTISHNTVNSDKFGCNGGAIHGVGSKAIIQNNTITSNVANGHTYSLGGGVDLVRVGSGSKIANNYIGFNELIGGSAKGGGIRVLDSETEILNNIIIGNRAGKGGGIYVYKYGKDKIINNTIFSNYASTYGGGLFIENANPKIFNTILWDSCGQSTDHEIRIENGSIDLQYSNIKGGWPGAGNIDVNPLFADTLFHLSDSSMCIGRGIDSLKIDDVWYYCPSDDIEGTSRPYLLADEYVDIGAYESKFPKITAISKDESPIPYKFILYQNYPNPFNPKTTISYQLPFLGSVELSIYNILGQKVTILVNKKQPAGVYTIEWDATGFASGVYFYRLEMDKGFMQTRKLVVLK